MQQVSDLPSCIRPRDPHVAGPHAAPRSCSVVKWVLSAPSPCAPLPVPFPLPQAAGRCDLTTSHSSRAWARAVCLSVSLPHSLRSCEMSLPMDHAMQLEMSWGSIPRGQPGVSPCSEGWPRQLSSQTTMKVRQPPAASLPRAVGEFSGCCGCLSLTLRTGAGWGGHCPHFPTCSQQHLGTSVTLTYPCPYGF